MNEGKEDAKREARDTTFEQQPAGDSRSEMGAESAAAGSPAKRHRLRRILAPILVALAVLVFTVTVPAAWGARTVLNTDRYVATVEPLADDPAVQQSIATRLTDQVFAALNVQEVISSALASIGERATLLAGPLTNALHGFVQDQVLKVVQSDAFQTFWVEANRFVHTQVLAVLRGEGDTVAVVEGKVTLNLLPLVNLALGSIERVSSDLVGGQVTLPTIQPGDVPSEAIARLEQALGIDLPDNYGQIVVYDSQDLEALQKALYWSERLLILLLIVIPILIAAALLVSTRRRRTLIQLTVGGAIGLVIVRRVAIIARDSLFDRVNTQRHPAVRVLTDTLMDSLFRYTGILLAIVLLTLVIALISGPYPWAVATRRWVADLARGVGAAVGGKPLPETTRVLWIRQHRDALMLAGAMLLVVLLLWVDLSWLAFVMVGLLLALYEIALWRVAQPVRKEGVSEAAA